MVFETFEGDGPLTAKLYLLACEGAWLLHNALRFTVTHGNTKSLLACFISVGSVEPCGVWQIEALGVEIMFFPFPFLFFFKIFLQVLDYIIKTNKTTK